MLKQEALHLAIEIQAKIPEYRNQDIFDLADQIMNWYLNE